MAQSAPLKLVALDAEDLTVVSAHVQDAVLKVRDLVWDAQAHRFALAMNRFAWEASPGRPRADQRRRTVLHFDRVLRVRSARLRRDTPDAVLELLALSFVPGDAPAGEIVLHFAGGPEIRLTVECIEAQLADLGAAWQTRARPAHDLRDAPEAPGIPSK